jgi:hypothetical protein
MPDYDEYIGGSTTLRIRDTGGWVEFWVQTGPLTWNNQQPYSFYANDTFYGGRTFRMVRGGGWQYVDHVWVEWDQDVEFTLYDTGLGFPTHTFEQHIQRTTVPEPPNLDDVTAISSSAFSVSFSDNSDGGSEIVERQIGYGASSNGPTSIVDSDGTSTIGGFSSGQKVYFWARCRNDFGWSDWSERGEGVTWQVPPAPGPATFYDIKQKSLGVSFQFKKRPNDPPNLEKQFRYGRDATAAVIDGTVTVDESIEYLTNLDPGKTYYFWGRARNSVGWGPWSAVSSTNLIAGARVLVSGTWRRAVPYVRVGGIWKVAEPWVKDQGDWKKTSL